MSGRCLQSLIQYTIDSEKCTGCGRCIRLCPQQAIKGEKNKPAVIELDRCVRCGICREACRFEAVLVE